MTTHSNEIETIFNRLSDLRTFLLMDDPNKNNPEDYDRLSEWETAMLKSDIQSKLAQGWTNHEIYSMISNTEHINPILDEDIAISRMTKIHKQINERLGIKE